jgi:hypothetical protein
LRRISDRLVNSKDEELVFYYAECKDTWGGPRDPTSGLCSGSRGSCPYDSWLSSLILLTLLSNCSSETVVYVVGVSDSFAVDSFGSDAWTRSFFASGFAWSSSGCFVVVVVALSVCH